MLTSIEEELHNLPDPPSNALQVVTHVLNQFDQAFRRRIDGEKHPNDLSNGWKDIKRRFRLEIISTQRPNLIVSASQNLSFKGNTKHSSSVEPIILCSEDDVPAPATPSSSKKRKIAQVYAPSSVGSPAPTSRGKSGVLESECE